MKIKKSRLEMMKYELQESMKSVAHMEMLLHDLRITHGEIEQQVQKPIHASGSHSGYFAGEFYEKSLTMRCDNLKKTISELSHSLDARRSRMMYLRKAIGCLQQARKKK
ncbi:MAG: hypothetical protein PW790_08300 [Parvibaculaceae bacterium]|nr:hypothetical protein [Parvibaculaceae bacterium]